MTESENRETTQSIDYIVSRVAERGWTQCVRNVDDFAVLRSDKNFRIAQTTEIYEQYFLPERHEWEWQILEEIIKAIVGTAVVTGSAVLTSAAAQSLPNSVLGNAAYDVIKTMCRYAASLMRKNLGHEAQPRAEGFEQIAADAELLKTYFSEHSQGRIREIEESTGIPREKIYPLIKLVGCSHVQAGDERCNWRPPVQK